MHGNAKDLNGQRFGKLVALEPTDKREQGSVVWRCQCDCGQICLVSSGKLNAGHTKSCGCLRESGGPGAKLPGMAVGNVILRHYKRNAAKRELPWGLTDEQALAIFGQNCRYCDMPPSNVYSIPRCNGDFVYNGIDRVDNTLGYTSDNCVPCCKYCNQAKNDMPLAEFKAWLTKAYECTIKEARWIAN